ncbi:hypothetical protein L873DRAFT_1088510 [Choiromyces venosus 120613-1]|uniref:Uncharacterized protein n=1 Tax=Choiromyces venosus 120613-1 TaxID=1336337 RepID=A0A3N4JLC7_9PEZI|nr:hypothetical protein L873DRAFT_1088510 [Choiromyces venosus 120613-1]
MSNPQDARKRTPLQCAAMNVDAETVRPLIARREANVKARDQYIQTSLWALAGMEEVLSKDPAKIWRERQKELLQILLDNGGLGLREELEVFGDGADLATERLAGLRGCGAASGLPRERLWINLRLTGRGLLRVGWNQWEAGSWVKR